MNKDPFDKLNMYRFTYAIKEGDVYVRHVMDLEGFTKAQAQWNFRDYIIENMNRLPNEVKLINVKKVGKA
nr:MAG TPA: hypothetical protein [Bacteriophage sp.]